MERSSTRELIQKILRLMLARFGGCVPAALPSKRPSGGAREFDRNDGGSQLSPCRGLVVQDWRVQYSEEFKVAVATRRNKTPQSPQPKVAPGPFQSATYLGRLLRLLEPMMKFRTFGGIFLATDRSVV
jgi:hypothetical protein